MPRNGSGVQTSPGADYPAVSSTLIESAKFNNVIDDINNGLSASIAADGQTTITANIPMNSKKHTGLANGSARTDSTALGQVQDGTLNWVAGGGTADAITATYSPAITALVDGQICCVRATAANATTTPTFAPNGLTARTIVRYGGQALVVGDIRAVGHELLLRYLLASTRWELLNPATTTLSNGASTEILVGGGAGSVPVWTTATGTGAPVRAGSPTFTGSVLSSSPTAGIGYATGAGGTVTQTISITNAVTLNKVCGEILLVSTAFTAGTAVKFSVSNTAYDLYDTVSFSHRLVSGTTNYFQMSAVAVAENQFDILLTPGVTSTHTGAIYFHIHKTPIS